jgi:predicted dehydrogenase
MLRFGILGASRFALKRMLPAMRLSPEIEVVAIASRDAGKAAEVARAHGIPRAHGSYEALLADPGVDAVYNPLPNHLHVPWSERAAAAGKHVLCEKPIATTAADARRLLAARDRAGVIVCEAAMVRLQPRWQGVRQLLRAGRIGQLRAFQGTFGYSLASRTDVRYEASMGGGVLYDTGFYPVTMSRFCFEAEPVAVLPGRRFPGPTASTSSRARCSSSRGVRPRSPAGWSSGRCSGRCCWGRRATSTSPSPGPRPPTAPRS